MGLGRVVGVLIYPGLMWFGSSGGGFGWFGGSLVEVWGGLVAVSGGEGCFNGPLVY